MTKKVIILRAPSGTGKSTYAKTNYGGANIMSSDDFWKLLDPTKTYQENFNMKRLGEAHSWNLRRFINLLNSAEYVDNYTIVVDNTNTTVAEIAPYYAAALAFGWEPEIISLVVHPDIAFERNVHGVPKEAHRAQVERFYRAFDDIPPWWNHKTIELGV